VSSFVKVKKVLLCLVLEAGVLMGAPVRQNEIEILSEMMHQTVAEESAKPEQARLPAPDALPVADD
jgi:hypothetical protein